MKRFSKIGAFLAGMFMAGFMLLWATQNTEIMTEIGPALGYNASVKQLLHVSNDDGISTTRAAIYDADGTASYLLLGTTSIAVNDGTDNWLLMSGLATTLAIGDQSGDDFVLEDTAGVDLITIQGDTKDVLFTLDGTAASDFLINDGGGVIFTVASDENAVTWTLDATGDADYSIGKSGTEQFLLETDIGQFTLTSDAGYALTIGTDSGDDFQVTNATQSILLEGDTGLLTATLDGGFDIVIGTDSGDDFAVSDGTDDLIHVQGDDNSVTINLATGVGNDFLVHDGTNSVILVEGDKGDFVVAPAGEMAVTLGTDANDDFYVTDGTDRLIDAQGDLGSVTVNVAAAAGNDFAVNNGTDDMLLVEGDLDRVTIDLDGGADADFAIVNASTDMLRLESDGALTITPTTALAVVIGGDGGDDFSVNDATDDLIHIQGDDGSVTFNFAAGSGNDFAIHDGTQNIVLVETDDQTVEFIGDVMIVNGAYDFDVASHDGTNGLMLEGVLVTSSAAEVNKLDGLGATMAELNIAADVLTEVITTTKVINATESGTRFILNTATAFATDLPAPAAGLHFWFYIGATEPTSSHTIVTNASANIIEGQISTPEGGAGSVVTAADSDRITFVANLAIHGDYVYVWSDGTHWYVNGMCKVQDGITTDVAS